jgi:DNA polymerase II
MSARGLILQASYRVLPGPNGERTPVVYLFGRLEDGATFLVRDDRQRPHFYIRALDAERAWSSGAPKPAGTALRNFAGAAVCRLETATPQDVPGVRDRLQAAGIET